MSNPHPTVTLTREHRNAIREHIHHTVTAAGDLGFEIEKHNRLSEPTPR